MRYRFGFFRKFTVYFPGECQAIFAERSSSAINVLGAEHAARSMIRDKHVYSL
jgi:hypothetical protein